MYIVSPHVTRRENKPYNTNCQVPPHQARNVAISAAPFFPYGFFPFLEIGGTGFECYDTLCKCK